MIRKFNKNCAMKFDIASIEYNMTLYRTYQSLCEREIKYIANQIFMNYYCVKRNRRDRIYRIEHLYNQVNSTIFK